MRNVARQTDEGDSKKEMDGSRVAARTKVSSAVGSYRCGDLQAAKGTAMIEKTLKHPTYRAAAYSESGRVSNANETDLSFD